MEDGHQMFFFERIFSRQKLKFLIVANVVPFLLWWSFPRQLDCHYFFPLDWEDWAASHRLALTPICSWALRVKLYSWFLSYLYLFIQLLPSMGFDGSHMNFYSVEKVVLICLKQHKQGHTCGAYKRDCRISQCIPAWILLFLNHREELIHGHFGVILIKLRKEPGFHIDPRIDGVIEKASEPVRLLP